MSNQAMPTDRRAAMVAHLKQALEEERASLLSAPQSDVVCSEIAACETLLARLAAKEKVR